MPIPTTKPVAVRDRPLRPLAAFSLVEVVVAVGIFAISIVAVIGLLAPTSKNVAAVRDTDDSSRVVSAIQSKLQETASASGGFNNIIGYLQDKAADDPADGAAYLTGSTEQYTLYASRDGTRIGLSKGKDSNNANIFTDNKQKYFEVVLIRDVNLSKKADDANAGYLAFTMRLRWPAFTPEDVEFTQHTQKSVLLVPASVHR